MEKICKNCKYFSPQEDDFFKERYPFLWGKCNSEKFVYTGDLATIEKDGMAYWDSEGYAAGFSVAEEFGCIHWEAK